MALQMEEKGIKLKDTVKGWIVSLQNSYVEAPTPSASECDCVWRQDL